MARKYELKRRARKQEDTRERILEAVRALHESLGPRNTTISAVAERAGVQRLTVYRHFPDENALFQACTGSWLERNPPPSPEGWRALPDAGRAKAALTDLYRYYRRTERMWAVSHRDENEVPALKAPMQAFRDHLEGLQAVLLRGLRPRPGAERLLRASLGHALEFQTWRSLKHHGLKDGEMAALVERWLDAAAA
jgi:AcrR family transcriptional regulator